MIPTQILILLGLTTATLASSEEDKPQPPIPSPISPDTPPHIPLDLERSLFFQELLSWHEQVPRGWISRKNTLYERILSSLNDDPVLLAYFLDPANNRAVLKGPPKKKNSLEKTLNADKVQRSHLRIKEPASTTPPSNDSYFPALPMCSGGLTRTRGALEQIQGYASPNFDFGFFGCRWVDDDPRWARYWICASDSILTMPKLPDNATLDMFELSDTKVSVVPELSFWNATVKSIRINGNVISEVDPRAFFGTTNTTLVQMMHNKLEWIWFEGAFEGLDNLMTLQLDFNGISLEGTENFCLEKQRIEDIGTGLPNLRVLSLRQNPLKYIPRTFFAPFRNSKVNFLVLDSCELVDIHPEALIYFTKLLELELGENPGVMENLLPALEGLASAGGKLRDLGLSSNSLQIPPADIISIFHDSLVTLDLHKNPFWRLGPSSFPASMPKLKNLNLADCNLKSLHPGIFDGMPNLEVLMLNENHFTQIPAPIGGLHRLLTLDISDNIVEDEFGRRPLEIPNNAFQNLEKLRILTLTNSKITELRAEQLKGLVRLRLLYLNACQLKRIHDLTFTSTPALITLNLSNNQDLLTPNADTFYGLGALQTLYLNFTDFRIHRNAPLPTRLEIETGEHKSWTNDADFVTIGSVFANRGALGQGNSFSKALEPFKYLHRLQWLYLRGNKLTFLHSKLFSTLPLLKTLVLTDNKIEVWREHVFENNTKLETVYLNENELHSVSVEMLHDFGQKPAWPALGSKVIDLVDNSLQCDTGICQMKEAVEEGLFELMHWEQERAYQCRRIGGDGGRLNIPELSSEFCESMLETTPPPTNPVIPEESTTTTTTENVRDSLPQGPGNGSVGGVKEREVVVIVIGSFCVLLLVVGAVYLKRAQFHLFWFGLKLNVLRQKARDKNPEKYEAYDYDVFISYSQLDSDFVQELVPKLEGTGKLFGTVSQDMTYDMDGQSTCSSTMSFGVGNAVNEALRVCLHLRDFQVGAPITENIIECVDRSRKVLVVISRHYLESQWCLFEMNLAFHRLIEGRRSSIVLVLLESIPSRKRSKVLSHLMRSRTYLQFPPPSASTVERDLFWKRLKVTLSSGSDCESNC